MNPDPISDEFPFESKYVNVHGSRMHYVDEGRGDPVLFLHGNPTSSYLWRNILPYLSGKARAIAPDLIGMGKSDKPESPYRFFDHYRYLEGFIEALGLERITLVIHDWGSGLGFHYWSQHPENVRGIAFMEAIWRPLKWQQIPPGFRMGFRLFRTPLVGTLMNGPLNFFVNQLVPRAVVRKLSATERARYREPFGTVKSRRPVWQWPKEVPIEGKPADVTAIVQAYHERLIESPVPKLMFYAHPGGLISRESAEWIVENFPNTEAVDVGEGIHYLQEDHPHLIGEAIAAWYDRLDG
jgi:haloalkane dehalogenase